MGTKYNIDVYIMGTKDHMSDYASRYPDKTLDQLFQDDTLPTRTLPKDLPMCTRCKVYTLPEEPHTDQCNMDTMTMKELPTGHLPPILSVHPSAPQTVEHDGGKTTFRTGNITVGSLIYIDFPKIFQCLAQLPNAPAELDLSPPMMGITDTNPYHSESQQLVSLINNIDKEYPERLRKELLTNRISAAETNEPQSKFSIHPLISSSQEPNLNWITTQKTKSLVVMFLGQTSPSKPDMAKWPILISGTDQFKRRPRHDTKLGDAIYISDTIWLAIACVGPLKPDTGGLPLSILVKLLKQIKYQARKYGVDKIILDGKGIHNHFRLNETEILTFLSALYKDYDSTGTSGPRSHIVLAPNHPTTTTLSLSIPVFLQERGTEAYKFNEVPTTITPQGVAVKEIISTLTHQLKEPLSHYRLFIDRRNQRSVPLHDQNLCWEYSQTQDSRDQKLGWCALGCSGKHWCNIITAESLRLVPIRPPRHNNRYVGTITLPPLPKC